MDDRDASSSDDEKLKYVPKPLKRKLVEDKEHEYVPTYKEANPTDTLSNDGDHTKTTLHHRFVITLDGINKNKCKEIKTLRCPNILAKTELENIQSLNRKNSPIIFAEKKTEIPEALPIVHQPTILKVKERCKYWPVCNKGEKCEYLHPNTLCKNFPRCKFGDKCLYLHPPCKFENSCTKKDCPFSHLPKSCLNGPFLPSQLQQCKFFPNCSNAHCTFYHPRPCRFGKFCKNKSECNFLHSPVPPKQSLTWRN
ncbi:zinc finger CCCH domain-containing protein 14 [Agrilus planipennis]|uniref:Zinc finger CCCH domain-containing protein 14 n=1 Tax=Agrilus planipennis TaxID=224129 RepID=A0A7F5R717_AGRPL|nr:zinc finger CCCH domain-containing protein 14 [Agrilus planipennis]